MAKPRFLERNKRRAAPSVSLPPRGGGRRKAAALVALSTQKHQGTSMTTVQINLPDELAQKAASAGLLSAEAMEAMLREQLRRRGGEALRAMWQREPQQELTPEIEQEIVQQVCKVRAERRLRGAS